MTLSADPAARRDDTGFTLVETLVSLMIMGMVMASLAVFFSRSMTVTSRQGDRQVAAQLVTDGVDQLRKVPGCRLRNLCGNSWPPPTDTHTVDRIVYTRTYSRQAVVPPDLLPVAVTVTWKGCSGTCSFTTTTLISTAVSEPVFNTP